MDAGSSSSWHIGDVNDEIADLPVVVLWVSFFLSGGAREHRDIVSVLPICLNKEKMGWGSST